jgi:hypothetical protein
MKSPHGQPSPALLRSIYRPHLRHNAEETGGDPASCRPGMVAQGFVENDLEIAVSGTQITVAILKKMAAQMIG